MAAWLFLIAYTSSGLAGLVYEVTWTRLLTLYIGHTTAAASAVVAAFLCGLAVGAAAGGRVASTVTPRLALQIYIALEIAVALAARPRILFLDEPTAGLGTQGTARIRALIERLKTSLTIVLIEHDMRFLFGLADRISVIHWGQVIAEGTPAELMANPWVRRSELGAAA